MVQAVPDILARIVDRKRLELRSSIHAMPRWEEQAAARLAARRDFASALRSRTPAVIAEIKQASPSKGRLAENYDPPAIARAYERGGAAALSVLTDRDFFEGSLADLEAARDAVELPALRKDFTLEEAQIVEAAAHGADAILLIAALHDRASLERLLGCARGYSLAALVEVHDAEELQPALDAGAEIIGVNNRDLRTFEVTLQTSLDLAVRIPPDVIKVSESGIHSRADIGLLREAGYQAFLVGERLMRAADPAAALRELAG